MLDLHIITVTSPSLKNWKTTAIQFQPGPRTQCPLGNAAININRGDAQVCSVLPLLGQSTEHQVWACFPLLGRYQKEEDGSQSLASITLIWPQSLSCTLEWAAVNLHCLTEMLVASCHSLHPSPVFVRWKHNNQSYFIIIVWLWVFSWLTKDNIWTLSATNPGLPAFCELDSVCFWPDLLAIWLPKAKG